LAASTDRSVVPMLSGMVADPKRELAARQAAVSALTRSKPGANALLELAKSKKLPADLTPLAASLLHNVSFRDVRDEAAKVLPVPTAKGSEQLPPMQKLLGM